MMIPSHPPSPPVAGFIPARAAAQEAVHMRRAGDEPNAIAALLGHAQVTTTERFYARLDAGVQGCLPRLSSGMHDCTPNRRTL